MARNWDLPITFTVEGRGDFPFDMLRHSMAWPATSEDAALLGHRERRRISVTASMIRHVSVARWKSFGWPVVDGFDARGLPVDNAPDLELR